MNAAAAKRAGLLDESYVRLRNQDGVVSNRVRLKATQRVRLSAPVPTTRGS